ncbi:MAG TPA: YegP family protein, partial [Pyrinomonadaceae bacterium]|nr:YegP family protein [Pyrinomonadaceae bacterium]
LSSEMYESKSACENGIASIQKNAGDAAKYDRRTSSAGDPYFVLKAGNGQEIGRSETYQGGNAAMENGIESVMKNAPEATIVDTTAG